MISVLLVLTVSQTACRVTVTEVEQNQMFAIRRQEFVSVRSDKSNYFCIHKHCLHTSDYFVFNGVKEVSLSLSFQ